MNNTSSENEFNAISLHHIKIMITFQHIVIFQSYIIKIIHHPMITKFHIQSGELNHTTASFFLLEHDKSVRNLFL